MTHIPSTKIETPESPEKDTAQEVGKKMVTVKTEKRPKGKAVREVPYGRVYIKATYNNTMVTFTDLDGNVLGWSSSGKQGFRGPKKATPYAATVIMKDAVERVSPYKMREVDVFVRGVGSGRESAIRALNANGLNVLSIKDVTPIPHNGCRPPKVRRI